MTDYIEKDGSNNVIDSEHPVLLQYKNRIAELELTVTNQATAISDLRSKNYDQLVKHSGFKQTVTDLLTEGLESGDISQELAEKWAKDLDIELTREVLISGTISFSGKVHVSIFEDIDRYNLMSNVSVDSLDISAFGQDLERFDYDVDDIEGEDV